MEKEGMDVEQRLETLEREMIDLKDQLRRIKKVEELKEYSYDVTSHPMSIFGSSSLKPTTIKGLTIMALNELDARVHAQREWAMPMSITTISNVKLMESKGQQ